MELEFNLHRHTHCFRYHNSNMTINRFYGKWLAYIEDKMIRVK